MSKKSNNKKRTFKDTFSEIKVNDDEPGRKKQKLNDIPKLQADITKFKYKDYCKYFNVSEHIGRQLSLTVTRFNKQFPQTTSDMYLTFELFKKILSKTKWTNNKLKSIINNSDFDFTLHNISFNILYKRLFNKKPSFFRQHAMSNIVQVDKKTYLKEFDSVKYGPLYKQKWARANLRSFDYKQMIKEFRTCDICLERKMVDDRLKEQPFKCKRCISEYKKKEQSVGNYIYRFGNLNNMDPGLQPTWAQGL